MNNLVTITLYGDLGEQMGQSVWKLAVKSVAEAIRVINMFTKGKLNKFFLEKDKQGIMYKVKVNEKWFKTEQNLDNLEELKNSELVIERNNLKTIDIIPVLQGAGDDFMSILTLIVGVSLVVVGILGLAVWGWTGIGAVVGVGMILGGLGLIAAGVINLLSSPPQFEDFREISNGSRPSFLFNGPANVVGEGGPVPIGYGRLIIGSQVVATSYEIRDVDAAVNPFTT